MLAGAFAAIALAGCAFLFARGEKPITLAWYGLAHETGGAWNPLGDGTTLATGDGIQLHLSVSPAAFVYVLHQTIDGRFAVLWPTATVGFDARLADGRVVTIPAHGSLYTMRLAHGSEAIFIIASRKPILDAERLVPEVRWLFATAQAIAAEVPADRIKRNLPKGLAWRLDLRNPPPVQVADASIPVALAVQGIGARLERQVAVADTLATARPIHPEELRGADVVARVVRLNRVIARGR